MVGQSLRVFVLNPYRVSSLKCNFVSKIYVPFFFFFSFFWFCFYA